MGLFRKNKNVFKVRTTIDEPMTRAQLLDSMNNIAAGIRNVTAMIEHSNAAERRLVSDALVSRFKEMIRRMEFVVQQDSEHDTATGQERETILTRQQQNTRALIPLSDLKIPYYELARIFDDSIVVLYRYINDRLDIMPTPFPNIKHYDDNRISNMIYYNKCISDCKSLIDRINQHVKDHDPASKTD